MSSFATVNGPRYTLRRSSWTLLHRLL